MNILISIIIAVVAVVVVKKIQGTGVNKISPQKAMQAASSNKNLQFLDVRTANEIATGKIKKARTGFDIFDVNSFKKNIENLPKDKEYIIYCASGHRSLKAYKVMKQSGFNNIYSLIGGYSSWKRANN